MTVEQFNIELFESYVKESGLRIGFICERLGISRQAFALKRQGKIPFKGDEVLVLCDLLRIPKKDKIKIFLP